MDNLKVVAHIHTGFNQKFGIPRQSGIVPGALGYIVFEKEYRDPKLVEGIDGFDYLWLLWGFSKSENNKFTATVRPPRLGGKTHMGVFATRAPYRPNNIGLSSVKLEKVELDTPQGPVITVSGVDMLDGTPIYDIKPYVTYADCHVGAKSGFADSAPAQIPVSDPVGVLDSIPKDVRQTIIELLQQDPRPAYDVKKDRSFRLSYDIYDVEFIGNPNEIIVSSVKNIK